MFQVSFTVFWSEGKGRKGKRYWIVIVIQKSDLKLPWQTEMPVGQVKGGQLSVAVSAHGYSRLSALSVGVCSILIISCYVLLFHAELLYPLKSILINRFSTLFWTVNPFFPPGHLSAISVKNAYNKYCFGVTLPMWKGQSLLLQRGLFCGLSKTRRLLWSTRGGLDDWCH